MTSSEPIGGFFGLEPGTGRGFPQADALLLGSGRTALEYVVRATGARHVHVARYTCGAVIEPLDRLGISWSFHGIDERLQIDGEIEAAEGELLVYVNYFGVMDDYCRALEARYGSRLVIDCSQALYFRGAGSAHCLYSPRKFVGVPDGGCLRTDQALADTLERDHSENRYVHLVGRVDRGPEAVYAAYQASEASLSGQPLKRMSRSTEQMLGAIDFDRVRMIRRENFDYLHSRLGAGNRLSLPAEPNACPLVYPYLSNRPGLRARLLAERVYVATYWPEVLRWCAEGEWEHRLASDLLPLPIDQRYGSAEMERIVEILR